MKMKMFRVLFLRETVSLKHILEQFHASQNPKQAKIYTFIAKNQNPNAKNQEAFKQLAQWHLQ
jgi:hypothetical protein